MVDFPIQRRGSAVLFYDLAQSLITEGHQQYTPEVFAGIPALVKLCGFLVDHAVLRCSSCDTTIETEGLRRSIPAPTPRNDTSD